MTVYDEGTRTRSFCYVSDLVKGMVRLLTSDEANWAAFGLIAAEVELARGKACPPGK